MSRFQVKPVIQAVDTPDFGVVHVRALSASEYLAAIDSPDAAFVLVATSICESDGSPAGVAPADVATWPMRTFDPVSDAVIALNGLEKKVAAVTRSGSPSTLPNDSAGATSSDSSAS